MRAKVAVLIAVLALSGCPQKRVDTARASTPQAQTSHVWKMGLSWPKDFPIYWPAAERFAKNVEAMSAGRLKLELIGAEVNKKPLALFDAIKAGEYDLAHTVPYYYDNIEPALLLLSTTPFGFTATEQNAWFYYGGGLELMQKALAPHNMVGFPAGNTHVQMGGWFQKEIKAVADLKGIRMRIPGHAGRVMAKLGVEPTTLAGGEIVAAFESKRINAAEWVGPGHDFRLGLYKYGSFYYNPWHEPATETAVLISKAKFDALSADLRAIVVIAAKEASFDMLSHSYYENATTWPRLLAQSDVQVRTFPPDVIDALRKANTELINEMAGRSPIAREVIESQRAFHERARDWTRLSDRAFMEVR